MAKKISLATLLLLAVVFLSGCALPPVLKRLKEVQPSNHDCLGPAGYVWCESKQKCLKPSEESCPEVDVINTKETKMSSAECLEKGGRTLSIVDKNAQCDDDETRIGVINDKPLPYVCCRKIQLP